MKSLSIPSILHRLESDAFFIEKPDEPPTSDPGTEVDAVIEVIEECARTSFKNVMVGHQLSTINTCCLVLRPSGLLDVYTEITIFA